MPARKRFARKSGKTTVAKLSRRVSKLASELRPELKFVDETLDTTIAITGRVDQVMTIEQGLTGIDRVGDKVNLRYLSGGINLTQHASDTQDTWVRLVLVRGIAERNTAPTWANTFQSNSIFAHLCFSQKLFQEKSTTKVIWSKLVKLTPNNAGAPMQKYIKFGQKLGWTATFDGANTTAEDGGLYLFAAASQATNVPNYEVKMRLTFTDA